jgi:hypothetical protein
MLKYVCKFTVTGAGRIPMDMLRYDRATPLTQEDVAECENPSYDESNEVSIRMTRFTEHKNDQPTVGRWKSFGWEVSDITFTKLQ